MKTTTHIFQKGSHRLLFIPIAFLFLLSFTDCAKKGSPTGGVRDTIPPVIVRSSPENYTINFIDNEIRIQFDEYIKLQDLQKNLIISPPLEYQPIITPLTTSKTLKIKILDTLKENTTYSINFGQSIIDNNESNPFEYYKYVFSTGSYIDSLTLSGRVQDAELIAAEVPTTVMLYELNETYTDSLLFTQKPTYVTVTKDSTGTFELTNLKEGKYRIFALKEPNNDYTFQPQSDKIGFVEDTITLPTDTEVVLTLFKEIPAYTISKPKQASKNHLLFGYQGDADSLAINLLSSVPENFTTTTFRDREKDTLHYWYKPAIEKDSLIFEVRNYNTRDTVTTRIRDLYADTLKITPLTQGPVVLPDTLKISATTPIVSLNADSITVTDKDTLNVPAIARIDKRYNLVSLFFDKKENDTYRVSVLPGAITDFFEKTNDTLRFSVTTKDASDYGTLSLTIQSPDSVPLIVQLVNSKFKVAAEKYLDLSQEQTNRTVFFDNLNPSRYYLRIIYDVNRNKKWDTGNLLQNLQPEVIKYYPSLLEVRANWSLNETFILE